VTVVGAGAAGLYTALCAAREGARVTLVSATPLAESSSWWAQGGLAAAVSAQDTPERHLRDTITAGRGAVRESAARILCEEAPAAVRDLADLGVRFDVDRGGRLALGLEGGHSTRRIVHAGGAATGRRLVRQLSAVVAEHDAIDVLEGRRVLELLAGGERCAGVRLDDARVIASGAVVLATGGAAALWARTTNPSGAVGGGLLLALAAGATLADLELVQFHPTAVVGAN
jgi:L-aspartate oxidase